jgi:hypothetical protein
MLSSSKWFPPFRYSHKQRAVNNVATLYMYSRINWSRVHSRNGKWMLLFGSDGTFVCVL